PAPHRSCFVIPLPYVPTHTSSLTLSHLGGHITRSFPAASLARRSLRIRVTLSYVGLCYSGATRNAVQDINLDINDGEFLVLVGPSGCGKSTTLRMLAGLELPTEGTVAFDNDDVTTVPAAERDIAMVFQNYALNPPM